MHLVHEGMFFHLSGDYFNALTVALLLSVSFCFIGCLIVVYWKQGKHPDLVSHFKPSLLVSSELCFGLIKLICQRFGFVFLCWKCVGCCQVSSPVLIICRFKRIYEQSLSPCFVPVTKVTKTSAFSHRIVIKK